MQPLRVFAVVAATILSTVAPANAAQPPAAVRPSWVPADATAMSDCVQALGYIFWNPKRLPFGPTYGAYEGKPIFEEIMIGQADFEHGKNFNDIAIFVVAHKTHMHLCNNPSGKLPDFVLQDE